MDGSWMDYGWMDAAKQIRCIPDSYYIGSRPKTLLNPVDKISKVWKTVLHITLWYINRLSTPPPQIQSIVEILKNHTLPGQPRLNLFPHCGSRAKIPVVDLGIGGSQVFLS